MSRKGTKMGLGEFLTESNSNARAQPTVSLDNLPRGPRERTDDDNGFRGGRGGDRRDREPMRSDGSDRWRGDREREPMRSEGSDRWRGDRGSDRGGFQDRNDRPRRDEYAEERPAHLRLNLSRRGDDAPTASGARSNDRPSDPEDKFARAFNRFGSGDRRQEPSRFGDRDGGRFGGDRDSGRFGDRDSGRYGDRDGGRFGDRDSGRFGDRPRFGDRDGGRFGSDRRYDDERSSDRITSAFDRQTLNDQPDPAEVARLKKEEEKTAREAEKKRKAEEKKEAMRLAEEAAQKAAEEKKAAAAAAAEKAQKDEGLVKAILATNKKGQDLAKAAKTQLKGVTPAVVMAQVLSHNEESAISSSKWLTPDEYGALLSLTVGSAGVKDQLKALFALQLFMHEHRGREGNRTKGMMEMAFKALYAFDIIADEAFIEYKYDVDDTTAGKMQAIIETSEWLSWLESYEPSDDEEEEED
ncbi:Aste57867_175 [Aphanomyces stellatus]|uniref:Aste57867_175 protein n=1 Tax=Aphanomyces stellatus TaxID=120398 RepID=A0A485K315_9STRA|nr:hypothetical protein As57867_000175 [Aphanomyces stellatus]VFT77401.1 Aste57867_175 [Aphanomyces stellatus]